MAERWSLVAGGIRRFLGWWIGQLAWFVPQPLRAALAGRRAVVAVILDDEAAELALEVRGGSRPLGRIGLADPLPKLLARRLRRRPVVLRLPAERALRTSFALPAAVEENLGEVLRFELDRRTPFSPEDAGYAWRIAGRDGPAGTVTVELTLVPRPDIAAALEQAGRLGLSPDRLEVEAERPGGPRSGNLLAARQAPRRPWRVLGAAALAAGLALALLHPLHQAHREAARLGGEMAAAKAGAEKAERARAEIAALAESRTFLQKARQSRWTATEMLAEVTRLLPDDSWLNELSVGGGEVRIKGLSASSAALVAAIGKSPMLASPRFRAAVVQDPATGRERFDIAASPGGRTAP